MTDTTDYPTGVPHDVTQLFEEIALRLIKKGKRRFSARAILHHIRWEYTIERGVDWKCNNNHSASLARWFMRKHPHMNGFFELRGVKES